MSKKQTRRSVSFKGTTYQRLKDYCDASGRSVSGYLEEVIAEKLDAVGAPKVSPEEVARRERERVAGRKPCSEDFIPHHFTF